MEVGLQKRVRDGGRSSSSGLGGRRAGITKDGRVDTATEVGTGNVRQRADPW